jgi:hypothetical protein
MNVEYIVVPLILKVDFVVYVNFMIFGLKGLTFYHFLM